MLQHVPGYGNIGTGLQPPRRGCNPFFSLFSGVLFSAYFPESSAAAANRARVRHVPHGILSALADTSGATDHAHRDPRVHAFLRDPEIDSNMLQDDNFLLRDPFDRAHQF